MNKKIFIFNVLFFCLLLVNISCGNSTNVPNIGNNISYPSSIVALNSNRFLLLNTSASADYSDGNIQQYIVDSRGNYSLQNSLSVPAHGTEIAVSPDSKLVALSFDNSVKPTEVKFYSYSDTSNPSLINNISLKLYAAGGKQSIKRLGFFTPTGGGADYYLFGNIYSTAQDDGSQGGIPPRVFVAKIASDFSSAQVLFTLSYGIGDPNSFAPKSDSIIPYNYNFGSSAPTFDITHNLLLAFPTGSSGGYSGSNYIFPPYPDPFSYFEGRLNGNKVSCGSATSCAQPDLRVTSLIAVDFTSILNGEPLNNSTYFAPLAWNKNGIPYGAYTNGITISYPIIDGNSDSTSFYFQAGFWSSYWLNTPNRGNGNSSCYATNPTSISNQFNLNSIGGNGLLVSKSGTNGGGDLGYGNEVFQISGLDILRSSINTIKSLRTSTNASGESDFKNISSIQILDPFNTYYSTLSGIWVNRSSPIIPYMYSRTTNVSDFDSSSSVALDFSVLNFGSNSCLPYWVRDTYLGFSSLGMDSAWLTANPVSITQGSNSIFYNAVIDPTRPSNFSFPYADGAEICTNLSSVSNVPQIFCANFLKGNISRYNVNSSGNIFSKF